MSRISEMFAFVAEDSGPDDEGLVAMTMPGGMFMPMVGGDMARMDSLRPIAQRIAQQSGQKIKLVRFTQREDLDTIYPKAS